MQRDRGSALPRDEIRRRRRCVPSARPQNIFDSTRRATIESNRIESIAESPPQSTHHTPSSATPAPPSSTGLVALQLLVAASPARAEDVFVERAKNKSEILAAARAKAAAQAAAQAPAESLAPAPETRFIPETVETPAGDVDARNLAPQEGGDGSSWAASTYEEGAAAEAPAPAPAAEEEAAPANVNEGGGLFGLFGGGGGGAPEPEPAKEASGKKFGLF